ncbi:MAG: 50S ribosomal protein L11 methyltransferase [Erythrobacter sp.]|nr:50S ribosomal protein L11 methyltransferase [Erythrobacter sp.]
MSVPSGYSIADYGDMVDCEPRMSTYAEALKRAVTPDCSVIDIGAGFGIFALLACQYGAGSVVAIETDSSIELLRELAKANGCADRITIVRDLSTSFEPESKADVVISDLRGTMPLFESHIAAIVDARSRLLADGGKLLPMRDILRVALARSPKTYQSAHSPWTSNRFGLDLSAGQRFAVNDSTKVYLKPSALLSPAQDLEVLDYRTIVDPHIDSSVELTADRTNTAHGLLIWFDAEIAEGLTYSNAPDAPSLVYGQMFLPFSKPVRVEPGDTVTARIRARLLDHDYIWSWDCDVNDRTNGEQRLSFRQSTFLRKVVPPAALKSGSNHFVPERSDLMTIDRDCLDLVDNGRSNGEIAEIILDRYADRFSDFQQALDHVSNLLRRY